MNHLLMALPFWIARESVVSYSKLLATVSVMTSAASTD